MDKTNKTNLDTGGEFIRHLDGSGWVPVPRRLMDDISLSLDARGALGWLLTRPDRHKLFVRYAQQRLGISQGRWQRIRRELESSGYLLVEKSRTASGSWVWHYHVFDSPKPANPLSIGGSSIGRFSTDGSATGGKTADKKRHPKEKQEIRKTSPHASLRDAGVNAALLRCEELKAKAKTKTITPPPATQAKAKASPKSKTKTFREALGEHPGWIQWLDEQERIGRAVSGYWRRKCESELEQICGEGGWKMVDAVLDSAREFGYRSFSGWTDGVVP